MSKLTSDNQKHLSLQDRITIEKSLDQKLSFRNIASVLCKDPTTISKTTKRRTFVGSTLLYVKSNAAPVPVPKSSV